jgi:hypothetical protein
VPENPSASLDDLEALARLHFEELSEAELQLLHAASRGDVVLCGPNNDTNDPANDPTGAGAWANQRQIRADLIRWLCRNREAAEKVDPRGLQVYAGKISGELDLSFATIPFPLSFARCCFASNIYLTHASLPTLNLGGSVTRSIHADGIHVAGNVFLRAGFLSKGRVELRDAQIGGTLLCDGAAFENPGSTALAADRVSVKGSVLLKAGFSAKGQVRFLGAQIGSNLECDDGQFLNPGAGTPSSPGIGSLMADRINVGGGVFLRNAFLSDGAIRLTGSQIRGDLDCQGATLNNPGGQALAAENIRVGSNVFLRGDFNARGAVILFGAQIEGSLDCRHGAFGLINLQTATIKGLFRWTDIHISESTKLDLRDASASAIQDEETSWPKKGNLSLNGFSYVGISEGPRDARTRLNWLDRVDKFAPQPYRQLAEALHDAGDDRGAREVLFEMEHRRRKEEDHNWFSRSWSMILRRTIGYGQMSWWALAWLLGLTMAGSALFGLGYLGGAVAPNDKDAYQCFEQDGYPPAYYPHFNPIAYSLEHSFPLVNLGVKEKWAPDMGGPSKAAALHWTVFRTRHDIAFRGFHMFWLSFPALLRVCLWLQILLGWVLATLFVAGLTGIVKSGP